jgi:hypothetical protein
MPFQIRHDGKTYDVHTHVGDGLTRVEFVELERQAEPQPLDNTDEVTAC